MAFIKNDNVEVGDWGYTTRKVKSSSGYFEEGTKVQVTCIDEKHGYDLEDEYGNHILECGFSCFEKETDNFYI